MASKIIAINLITFYLELKGTIWLCKSVHATQKIIIDGLILDFFEL